MAKIDKKSLVEFFKVESEEHFELILNGLHVLSVDDENWSVIDEIFRSAHTIKGSAAMVGFSNVSSLAHQLENLFEVMRTGSKKLSKPLIGRVIAFVEDLFSLLQNSFDDIPDKQKRYLSERLDKIVQESEERSPIKTEAYISEKVDVPEIKEDKDIKKKDIPVDRIEILKRADETFDKILKTDKTDHFVHLKLTQVDSMVNILGELITNKNRENSKIKQIINRFEDLKYATDRLNNLSKNIENNFNYSYQYEQPLNIESKLTDEFSLGELDRYDIFNIYSRQLAEIVDDINISYRSIIGIFDDFNDDVISVNRLVDKLRRDITSVRMVPVDRLFNSAIRAAKTAAASEGKEIKILFSGENLSVDQSIFDVLRESFLHIVRNAVSHGIEDKEKRLLAGKEEVGTLIFRAQRYENFLLFEVEDDGSGVNLDNVRKRAIDKGLISVYEAENMRADKLMELLFLPGFSTKTEISDISGRGVGLDVVKDSVEKLGGNVKIGSEFGKGTKISIILPLREVIGEYLYIKENGQLFAIPLLYIDSIISIDTYRLEYKGASVKYNFRNDTIDIYDLGVLLKQTKNGVFIQSQPAVVLFYRGSKYIITVDEILEKIMTVTKPLPYSLRNMKQYSGATIMVNGDIALILDPSKLISDKVAGVYKVEEKKVQKTETKEYTPNSVLIVDDSLSIRKYLGKVLNAIGCYYEEATDGMSAINKLRQRKFDLIITDLEMPIMNGYELIHNIRSEILDRSTPIFVLTSRATEKHRNKAIELGANDFIMKPFDEDEISDKIKGVIFGKATVSE